MKVSISNDVFEVNDEQLEEIKKIVKKKEFKPILIHHGCFVVNVWKHLVEVKTGHDYPEEGCVQSPDDARRFSAALLSAADFLEGK